ncbi:MAG TPA: pseudouridine synthase [Planctomycetota bacterium]
MFEVPHDPLPAEPPASPAASPREASPHAPLRVLHLDDDFVAVSKPSGLLVHRDDHHKDAAAALQVVRDQVGRFLYPFHRLDRATSGILMFGFSSAAAAAMQAELAAPDAEKQYLALMRWRPRDRSLPSAWKCEEPLADEKDVLRRACTEFELEEAFRHCALVRCRITTGRYHQIRRHASHCGRHILGDTAHGRDRLNAAFRDRYGLQRLFLHLQRISMRHPTTRQRLELVDPLPAELVAVLAPLRGGGA